jgi:CheY-like chemotaxis protein
MDLVGEGGPSPSDCPSREELMQENIMLKKKLQEMSVLAESATEAKSIFLANVSHEIRTPLNGMIAVAQLLQRLSPTPEQYDLLRTIEESGLNLMSVLGDVLDFSCISRQEVELQKSEVYIRDIIEGGIESIASHAEERNICVTYRIDDCLTSQTVTLDPTRVRQVLCALLSNALKFNKEGGDIEIDAQTIIRKNEKYPKTFLGLSVRDTGVGMDPEVSSRLFEGFMQGDDSRTRKHNGTGLGLAISSGLVKAMMGSIDVTSVPGQGSVFNIQIPVETTTEGHMSSIDIQSFPNSPRDVNSANQARSFATISTSTSSTEAERHGQEKSSKSSQSSDDVSSSMNGDLSPDSIDQQEKIKSLSPVELNANVDMFSGKTFLLDISHERLREQIADSCRLAGASVRFSNSTEDSGKPDLCITTANNAGDVVSSGWRWKPLVVLGKRESLALGIQPMATVVQLPIKHARLISAIERALSGVLYSQLPLPTDPVLLQALASAASADRGSNFEKRNTLASCRRSVDNSALNRSAWYQPFEMLSVGPRQSSEGSLSNDAEKVACPTKSAKPFPRILIAEDNIVNVKVVQQVLHHVRPDAVIDVAGTGIEVLKAVESNTYDLILMDIHMPEMDGIEAARQLREKISPEECPTIVALSADTLQALPEKCLAAGMKDFVSKPFKLSDVERIIAFLDDNE